MMVTKNSKQDAMGTLNVSLVFQKLYMTYSKQFEMGKKEFTSREKEILHLMAIGHNSYEIADNLFISKHTVDTHRKNIYRKGGFNSLIDVILFALFNGIEQKNTL